MMKNFKMLLVGLLLAYSTTVIAKGVMMDMFAMKRQLNQLIQAENPASFEQAASAFLVAAEQAKQTMPESLSDDESQFKGYQAGMQEVIDVVKKADELAKMGKLEEAKALTNQLLALKKHYHEQYK